MNYDVLEESKNAIENLEDNAWVNHKENYVEVKGAVESFKDEINTQEQNLRQAVTTDDIKVAQDELTRIINDVQDFNRKFNTSILPVEETNKLPADPDDVLSEIKLNEPKVEKEDEKNTDDEADLFNLENIMNGIQDEDEEKKLDTNAIDSFLNNIEA